MIRKPISKFILLLVFLYEYSASKIVVDVKVSIEQKISRGNTSMERIEDEGCGPTNVWKREMIVLKPNEMRVLQYTREHCRWLVRCPSGYNCTMYCPVYKTQPVGNNCDSEYMLISKSGNDEMNDAYAYCGTEPVHLTSKGQLLTIELKSIHRDNKFKCELRAQPSHELSSFHSGHQGGEKEHGSAHNTKPNGGSGIELPRKTTLALVQVDPNECLAVMTIVRNETSIVRPNNPSGPIYTPCLYEELITCPETNPNCQLPCSEDTMILPRTCRQQKPIRYKCRIMTLPPLDPRETPMDIIEIQGITFTLGLISPDNFKYRCDLKFQPVASVLPARATTSSPHSGHHSNNPRPNIRPSQASSDRTSCVCGYRTKSLVDDTFLSHIRTNEYHRNVREYPMMVALATKVPSTITVKCQGVIIGQHHVLTSATCTSESNLVVLVGPFEVEKPGIMHYNYPILDQSRSKSVKIYKVANIRLPNQYIVHVQHRNFMYDYDIAILNLQENIEFSPMVGPACLPFKFAGQDFTASTFTMMGWKNFAALSNSNEIQKLNLVVNRQDVCLSRYHTYSDQLCVYGTNYSNWILFGSGVYYTEPETGRIYLMGISGFHDVLTRGSLPWYVTNVNLVQDWIKQEVGPDYCSG